MSFFMDSESISADRQFLAATSRSCCPKNSGGEVRLSGASGWADSSVSWLGCVSIFMRGRGLLFQENRLLTHRENAGDARAAEAGCDVLFSARN